MKVMNTDEYVSALRELVAEGHSVSMLIAGNSMFPFLIHNRDYIYFEKPNRELRVGDPVFFQRDNGKFVMHRICKVNPDGTFNLIGDNQTGVEPGIRRDQIFALVTQVKRNGKLLKPGDFWWEFFEKVWIRIIPLRRFVWRAYCVKNKLFRK